MDPSRPSRLPYTNLIRYFVILAIVKKGVTKDMQLRRHVPKIKGLSRFWTPIQ